MERLWAYIQDVRKIPLSDFSTDECVERVYKQLEAALAAAPTKELAGDLECIMNRRPRNRVQTNRRGR
jgi:hypothetical protein